MYLFFLSIYIIDKNDYGMVLESTILTRNLNWYVQIVYHFIYFWFTFQFINYFKHFPNQKKYFKIFTFSLLGVGSIAFLICTILQNDSLFLNYFLYLHIPLGLSGFIFILYKILFVKEPMKLFYIPAISFYLIFSLIAVSLTFVFKNYSGIEPISYFYYAVLIETTMFAMGLGIMIKLKFEENMQFQKEVEKLKVNALQNQMNSHFMFNTLNSLKSFIIENEKSTAINYLNKYAKLTRNYLEGGMLEVHSLKDELLAVQLYLDLENQRLNNTINFTMPEIENSLDSKHKIPTHLLIPLIEFAIWKGLFYKKNNKILQLKMQEVNENIEVIISDNGYYNGTKSPKLQDKEIWDGIAIAEKRIKFFNKSNHKPIVLSMDQNKKGGTIKLIIPPLTNSLNGYT